MSEPAAPASAPRSALESFTLSSRLALGAVLALAFVVRARMLEVPLGRDEGVYAYIGWLILHDVPLYTSTVDLQMPGLWVLYAGLMSVFGTSGVGIHLGLLVGNLLSAWFVFVLGRWLLGTRSGVIAAAGFAALSVSQRMLGFTANAEHFVVVFSLAGLVVLVHGVRTNRARDFFLAGLLLGVGLMMKQHGVFFVAFGGLFTCYAVAWNTPALSRANVVRVLLYGVGALAPFALACAWFAARGVFDEFLFWAFRYSSTYGFDRGLSDAIRAFKMNAVPIAPHTVGFLVLAAVGLVGVCLRAAAPDGDRLRGAFLIGLFVFSVACVFPGLVFRQHYFLMTAPVVALLFAAGVGTLLQLARVPPGRPAAIVAAVATLLSVGQLAVAERFYLFRMRPEQIARSTYKLNPVVELREIGAYIRSRTTPDDRIAVLGSEPQTFLYANRRSAATLIVMYPMMWAPPEMALELQHRTIGEIEAAQPKFVVAVDNATSWAFEEHSDRFIVRWADDFIRRGYSMVGVVEMQYPQSSVFIWGPEAALHKTTSRSVVRIYERRDELPPG